MAMPGSPFDNPQIPVAARPQEADFAGRPVNFFMKSILLLLILGFSVAAWLLYGHASAGSQEPAAAPNSILSGPASTTMPAETESESAPVSGSGSAGVMEKLGGLIGNLLGPGVSAGNGIDAQIKIDQAKRQASAQAAAAIEPASAPSSPVAYPGSVKNVLNSSVEDENNSSVGTVYDILVDRQTGMSTAVILNGKNNYRGIDLSAIHFTEVARQDASGDISLSLDKHSLESSPSFRYDNLPEGRYVSLRSLENGKVLDDRGKEAGLIDAVTYYNGSARNIVFTVPAVSSEASGKTFVIPYQDVTVVALEKQNAIQLDKNQTAALASAVFSK